MKERPILFSAPMVRALLDGSKTQTRRAFPVPESVTAFKHFEGLRWDRIQGDQRGDTINCPYGQPGDRLWVREAWRTVSEADELPPRDLTAAHRIWFEADAPHQPGAGKLRPSMFMPRPASRITLEVTGVRVERLQDISETDAWGEGVGFEAVEAFIRTSVDRPAGFAYRELWESINGEGIWKTNPWVWVVEFKKVTP
jgi:hypothetical protein